MKIELISAFAEPCESKKVTRLVVVMKSHGKIVMDVWGQETTVEDGVIRNSIRCVDARRGGYLINENEIDLNDIALIERIEFSDGTVPRDCKAHVEVPGAHITVPTTYEMSYVTEKYIDSVDLRDYQDSTGFDRLMDEVMARLTRFFGDDEPMASEIDAVALYALTQREARGAFDH